MRDILHDKIRITICNTNPIFCLPSGFCENEYFLIIIQAI